MLDDISFCHDHDATGDVAEAVVAEGVGSGHGGGVQRLSLGRISGEKYIT